MLGDGVRLWSSALPLPRLQHQSPRRVIAVRRFTCVLQHPEGPAGGASRRSMMSADSRSLRPCRHPLNGSHQVRRRGRFIAEVCLYISDVTSHCPPDRGYESASTVDVLKEPLVGLPGLVMLVLTDVVDHAQFRISPAGLFHTQVVLVEQ